MIERLTKFESAIDVNKLQVGKMSVPEQNIGAESLKAGTSS
jgi:hypothetical protein